jgi:phenylacetate-CoA ligase
MSLKILQLERLSKILEYVYKNNKIYQKKFDDLNVKPTDLKELNDIQKFPFTTKADLRDNYPFGLLCVPEKSLVRIHASSGTTGKSTIVGYTQKDIEVWSEVVSRSISAAGGKKGDKVQISYGYGLFTGGLGAHYGAEKLGLTVIPMSGGQTAKQVQFINDIKPEILMVTPSYALNIADEFERGDL